MGEERPKPIFVANRVEQKFQPIFYAGQFWYYVDGLYRPAEMAIRDFLQTILGKFFSSGFVHEVFYALQSRCFMESIKTDPQLLNLENGVYNWIEDKFYSHGEINERFITQLPVRFNPKAKCPKIGKFLDEIVSSEDKRALLQFIGYCFIPTTKFEKALLLIGEGANGKSTFLKVLINLLGKENVSTLSLYDLSQRFRLAEIVGKLANIFPDLPYRKVQDSSIFKAVSERRSHNSRKEVPKTIQI